MPGYADSLANDEIRATLAFMESRWAVEIGHRQASTSYIHGLHLH